MKDLHPTTQILDSTKIQTYIRCPRKYFFNYVLGWRRKGSNLHIEFGRAIHEALEHHNLKVKSGATVEEILSTRHALECFAAFYDIYRETQHPEDDDWARPKDPVTAETLLHAHMDEYGAKDVKTKILEVEVAGRISVGPDRYLHFKIDRIQEDENGVAVLDYKTASQMSKTWMEQWNQKFQIGCYTHVARMLYPSTWGMIIRGMFVYKTSSPKRTYGEIDFLDVECVRSDDDMLEWLNQANTQLDHIYRDYDVLATMREGEPYLRAFEKRTESCSDYGGCPYMDVCAAWHNPLDRGRPESFEVDFWDPRKNTEKAHVKVDL